MGVTVPGSSWPAGGQGSQSAITTNKPQVETGAHSQGATLDELRKNLREVIEMLLEDEKPEIGEQ